MGRMLVLLVALGLPFAAYFAYIKFARRKQALEESGQQLSTWQTLPWVSLIVSSVVLLIAVLVLLRFTGIDPDSWIGGKSVLSK